MRPDHCEPIGVPGVERARHGGERRSRRFTTMSDPDGPADSVRVRPAEPADAPGVLALWARARSAAAVTPDTTETVERLLARGPGSLLVAQDGPDGPIVGALIAAWDGFRGNMYRLAVEPAHRRRGIATALVRAGERHLRDQGAPRVSALVAHEEGEAVGLWAAVGYARDRSIVRFVRTLD
jgi:ribosomal protein S18 acetylase RimI-like enzyme